MRVPPSRNVWPAAALHAGALLLIAVACGGSSGPSATPPAAQSPAPSAARPPQQAPMLIKTTSYPADWLARRLAPSGAMVSLILPAGEDPPHWQPPGALVASLAEADLIVANGAGFEAWMATAALPDSKLVLSAAAVQTLSLAETTHSHGPDGAHSHGRVDPHTWGDPMVYAQQAAAVADGIGRARPAATAEVQQRLKALTQALTALDAELAAAWAPVAGIPLGANHPSFQYCAQRYGLQITPLDLDPSAPPTAAAIARVEAWAKGGGRAVLWEAAPTPAVTGALPAGLVHVVLDPLEQPRGDTFDYVGQSRRNIVEINGLAQRLALPAP